MRRIFELTGTIALATKSMILTDDDYKFFGYEVSLATKRGKRYGDW